MLSAPAVANHLSLIPGVTVRIDTPLSPHTRFGIGGPARAYVEIDNQDSFIEGIRCVRESGSPFVIVGNGTNLIVSDDGYAGVVLRLTRSELTAEGNLVSASAGAVLQDLVDFSIARGLSGIEVMTGIPGSVGGAVYGNAGAYGQSIAQRVLDVRFFDGVQVRPLSNPECDFRYRESIFKRQKDWTILSVTLALETGDAGELHNKAAGILDLRNRKYPPTMKCAGSIFKNLLLAELPESVKNHLPAKVVIEGKVPSAYFLEQVGAKGMYDGDIRVADYHANLIYNQGFGTAAQLCGIIGELKRRVQERFGFTLEEEVQYIGF